MSDYTSATVEFEGLTVNCTVYCPDADGNDDFYSLESVDGISVPYKTLSGIVQVELSVETVERLCSVEEWWSGVGEAAVREARSGA